MSQVEQHFHYLHQSVLQRVVKGLEQIVVRQILGQAFVLPQSEKSGNK